MENNILKIRLEEEKDYFEVENLVRNSFWNVYRPGAFEHFIVHNLRDDGSFIKDLAYVIEKDGNIIGHINYSVGKLSNSISAPVLGPIAIDKQHQRKGYGSKLIEFTLKLAKDMGFPFIFVIGDENYYSRFGFESASKYNLFLDGTDTTQENPFFMVKLIEEQFNNEPVMFHNPDVFMVPEDEVDEFDKQFEPKEKLVLEGQLGV